MKGMNYEMPVSL